MTFQELLQFIDLEDKRLRSRFGKNFSTEKEVILAKTVKLSEEVGELSSEVLGHNGDQREISSHARHLFGDGRWARRFSARDFLRDGNQITRATLVKKSSARFPLLKCCEAGRAK